MLSEQTLLNAAVLTVAATSADKALAGIVFDVLLIARAPLQLFQAIQTSLLPHLTGLETTDGHDAFARAIRITVVAIAAFAAAVALGLLAIGPFVMQHVLFGQDYEYGRWGLALIGVGMGLHLTSGALNQAALARDRARAAAGCWLLAAVVFVGWMFLPAISDQVLRVEVGYAGATALLAVALTRATAGAARGTATRRDPRPRRPRRRDRARDLEIGLAGVGRVRRSPTRPRTGSRPPACTPARWWRRCRRRPRSRRRRRWQPAPAAASRSSVR